jgi:hypothetical protein
LWNLAGRGIAKEGLSNGTISKSALESALSSLGYSQMARGFPDTFLLTLLAFFMGCKGFGRVVRAVEFGINNIRNPNTNNGW